MSETYFPAWMLVVLFIISALQLAERIYCYLSVRHMRKQWMSALDTDDAEINRLTQSLDHARRHLSIAQKVKTVYATRLALCVEALKTCQLYKPDAPGGPAYREYDIDLVTKALREARIAISAERVAIAESEVEEAASQITHNLIKFKQDVAAQKP